MVLHRPVELARLIRI